MTTKTLNLKFNADHLKREAKEVQRELGGIDKQSAKTDRSFASLAKTTALATAALGLAAGAIGFKLARSFTEAAVTSENYRVRLNALLGSQKEGNRAFEEGSKLAAKLPFQYEEIMGAVTTLSGVVTGGVDEITEWIPIIADLATVSGLSIEDTTAQVQKMMASGAGAAEMFKDRGINAMLGFQAGVKVSAEDTKRRLIAAYEDPMSKFRGASEEMAKTWDGTMSMISDKAFQFKNAVMDEGVFDYFKSLAGIVNDELGGALDSSTGKIKTFADATLDAFGQILIGGGHVMDFFSTLAIGLNVIHSASLNLANVWTNISSMGMYRTKIMAFFTGMGDEFQLEMDRMLLINQNSLNSREQAIAQNNIDILNLINNDWSEMAETIHDSAMASAKAVTDSHEAINGSFSSLNLAAKFNAELQAEFAEEQKEASDKVAAAAEKEAEAAKEAKKELERLLKFKKDAIQYTIDLVDQMDFERKMIGESTLEIKIQTAIRDANAKGIEGQDAAIRSHITALDDEQKELDRTKEALEKLEEEGEVFEKRWEAMVDNIQSEWADTIHNALWTDGLDSFGDFTDAILDMFKRMISEMVAAWAISGLIGIFTGKGFDGFNMDAFTGGGDFSSLFKKGTSGTSGVTGTKSLTEWAGDKLGLTESQTGDVLGGVAAAFAIYNGYNAIKDGNTTQQIGGGLQMASGGVDLYNAYQGFNGGTKLSGAAVNGLGMAGGLYGMYAGIKQGGPMGYGSAALGAYQTYQAAQSMGWLGQSATAYGQLGTFSNQFGTAAHGLQLNNAGQLGQGANGASYVSGSGGVPSGTSALGYAGAAVGVVGGLYGIYAGAKEGGTSGYAGAGAGAIGAYAGAATLSGGSTAVLGAMGPYGWAAMAALAALSALTGNAREYSQILQEDYLPDLLGAQAQNEAVGANGGIGFAGGGNTAIFGANWGNDRSGLTAQMLNDSGENGSGGFFTGAQESLDGFEAALRAAGFGQIGKGKLDNVGGVLRVLDPDQDMAAIQAVWKAYNDGLEQSIEASAVFHTAVENGLIKPSNMFFEQFALGFAESAFEAKDSLLAIDASFDEMVLSGMDSTEALFTSISEHYGIAIEDAQYFVEQSGVSAEKWVSNFATASDDALAEMLEFNANGVTAFESLSASALEQAGMISDSFKLELSGLEGYLNNIDLGMLRGKINWQGTGSGDFPHIGNFANAMTASQTVQFSGNSSDSMRTVAVNGGEEATFAKAGAMERIESKLDRAGSSGLTHKDATALIKTMNSFISESIRTRNKRDYTR